MNSICRNQRCLSGCGNRLCCKCRGRFQSPSGLKALFICTCLGPVSILKLKDTVTRVQTHSYIILRCRPRSSGAAAERRRCRRPRPPRFGRVESRGSRGRSPSRSIQAGGVRGVAAVEEGQGVGGGGGLVVVAVAVEVVAAAVVL